jgi:uncharacterized protein YkwD
MLCLLFFLVPSSALSAEIAGQAELVLQRLNEARANPRAVLARLGIAESTARAALAVDAWILDYGLAPLTSDPRLKVTAAAHGAEMLAVPFYGYLSRDGRTPAIRIANSGYPVAQSGETLAAVAFSRYVTANVALEAMLDNVLRDELIGTPGVGRHIFSPTFLDIGISLRAGTAAGLFADRPYVYVLVIDFGLPRSPAPIAAPAPAPAPAPIAAPVPAPAPAPTPIPVPEVPGVNDQAWLLWQRFNEARANPRATMTRLGIPEAKVRAVLGQDLWLLDQGLPPLAWNEQIRTAAQGHGRDMVDRVYYSSVSPEGRTLTQRLSLAGYAPLLERETLGVLVFDKPMATLEAAVTILCDNMLRDELSGTPGVARNIFSPEFSEIGLALLAETVPGMAGQPYAYLLVADFSRPTEERPFAVGRIAPGTSLVLRSRLTGQWEDVAILPGNSFQFRLSGLGEELFYWNTVVPDYVYTASTLGLAAGRGHFLDLRR